MGAINGRGRARQGLRDKGRGIRQCGQVSPGARVVKSLLCHEASSLFIAWGGRNKALQRAQQIHVPGGRRGRAPQPQCTVVQARRLPLRLPNRGEMSVGWPSAQAPSRRLTNWTDATKRPHDMAPDSHSAWPSACLTALTSLAVGDFLSRYRLPRSALALRPSQPVRVAEGVTVRLRRPETEPNALLLRCSMTSWRLLRKFYGCRLCVRALEHPCARLMESTAKPSMAAWSTILHNPQSARSPFPSSTE